MADIDDGGPAFPTAEDCEYASGSGMTLRDWFAGQAMIGSIAAGESRDEDRLAAYAYRYADAMLETRKKVQP